MELRKSDEKVKKLFWHRKQLNILTSDRTFTSCRFVKFSKFDVMLKLKISNNSWNGIWDYAKNVVSYGKTALPRFHPKTS